MRKLLLRSWRQHRARRRCVACQERLPRRATYCTLCGQERIERTRDQVMLDRL